MGSKIIGLLILFGFSVSPAFAATITVSPGQSIQAAVNAAVAGDTINVNAGAYNERVNITKSNLTLQALGQVITKGFNINNANSVAIKGFEVAEAIGKGIEVLGKNCVLENNYIHFASDGGILLKTTNTDPAATSDCLIKNNRLYKNAQFGLDIRGRNHTVENNEVWATIQHHPNRVPSPSWADADAFHFHGSGHIFKNNYIHDIKFDGTSVVDAHIDCFQTFDSLPYQEAASNITFDGNRCLIPEYESAIAATNGFMLRNASYLTIKNNLIYAYGGINTGGGGNHNLSILNNTWVGIVDLAVLKNCSVGSNCWPRGIAFETSANNTLKNNIFYNHLYAPYTADSASLAGLDRGYNLTFRADSQNWPANIAATATELWKIDPKFINPAGGDYRLQTSSPACTGGENATYIGAYPCESAYPSAPAQKPGDANGDNKVDGIDYVVWLNNYNQNVTGPTNGDFNNSGKVDGVDYVIWVNNYGK